MALMVFLIFQCLLIPSIYQGMVRAFMLTSPPAAPFSRFADVAKAVAQGKYRIAANNKGDWFMEAIHLSNDPSFVKIRNAKDSIIFTKSIDESLECVHQGRCITSLGLHGYAVYQARRKFCDLTYIWEDMPERELSFVFKTGDPLVELFNEAIYKERLVLDSIYRKYYTTFYSQLDSRCRRKESDL
ncbi:Protein W02A2.5 [Aphelenchoides avenae]|nr:Protein W02A2.5 [Aphelenchus avenae]